MSFRDSGSLESTRLMQEILKKQPKFGSFTAFLHGLFPNFNACKMLTINAEIKKNEQRSDKTYNVKLRFTLNRKIKRLSTTIFVTPKDLTKEFKIKQSSPFIKK